MSTTPNMNLVLPVETVTPGPEWATDINEALDTVDQHDHTVGKGVKVPSAGINIDNNLEFNSNKAIELKSTQYNSQAVALSGVAEANSAQFVMGDLWIVNGAGTAVQVTSGASVVAPSSSNTPAGIVLPYAGSSAPAGYLFADGAIVSRTTYATLFGAIGVIFGAGDGSTTFQLPNLSGRVPMGTGNYTDSVLGNITRALGETTGAAAHVLDVSQMPNHNHNLSDPGHNHNFGVYSSLSAGATNQAVGGTSVQTGAVGVSASGTGISIAPEGGGLSHNNMQPSLGLSYIIKT